MIVDKWKLTRAQLDQFAYESQMKAAKAQTAGQFDREITPITLPNGSVVSKDDGPRKGTTAEGLAQLKPVFREDEALFRVVDNSAGEATTVAQGDLGGAVLVADLATGFDDGLEEIARRQA